MISKLSAVAAAASLLLALSFAPEAQAQNRVLACQHLAASGLNWEQGQWRQARFRIEEPFALVLKDGNLDLDSVDKAMGSESGPSCEKRARAFPSQISCVGWSGTFLLFDTKTNRGTLTQSLGGIAVSANRDSLTVSPFVCQPL